LRTISVYLNEDHVTLKTGIMATENSAFPLQELITY